MIIKITKRNKCDAIANHILNNNILKNIVLKNYQHLEKKIQHQKIYNKKNSFFYINFDDTLKIIIRNSILQKEEMKYLYNLLIKSKKYVKRNFN